jgi:hypothetical protein
MAGKPGAQGRASARVGQNKASTREVNVSAQEFRALFARVSQWGRWGPEDERGALQLITPARIAAAAALVREGVTVSLSLPQYTTGNSQPESRRSPHDKPGRRR